MKLMEDLGSFDVLLWDWCWFLTEEDCMLEFPLLALGYCRKICSAT